MKKYLSLFLCFVFALSFASCGKKETKQDDYIGEGLKTQLKMLVMANLNFYSYSFVSSTLKTDDKNPIEKDGVKWLIVNDSLFASYDEFLTSLNVVYTPECVEKILQEYDFYAEIDGKFCIKADEAKAEDSEKWEMDPALAAEIVSNKENKISVKYAFKKGEQTKKQTYTFINTSSGYRLDKLYKLG